MKILHLITGLDMGGAEMMLYRLCEQQRIDDDEPFVVTLKSNGELKTLFDSENIPVVELGFPKGKFSISGFKLLIKLLRETHPDIVHCWMYHANLIGSLAILFTRNQPSIWSIHNTTLSGEYSSRLTILIMNIAGFLSFLPQKIVYCSYNSRILHEKLYYLERKGIVIPNGIDTQYFSPNNEKGIEVLSNLEIEQNQIVIGNISRYDPQKDHANFILAADRLLQKHDNLQFILCGPGIEETNIELIAMINKTKAPEKFHLLGRQYNIERIHNSFDIFVFSSAYGEAFPIVLAEAMSCGVLCVATDVGDSSYIVGDTGKIVPIKDPQAMANAVEELLAIPKEEMNELKRTARTHIVDKFSLTSISKLYKDTYEKVIKGVE